MIAEATCSVALTVSNGSTFGVTWRTSTRSHEAPDISAEAMNSS